MAVGRGQGGLLSSRVELRCWLSWCVFSGGRWRNGWAGKKRGLLKTECLAMIPGEIDLIDYGCLPDILLGQ